jgi:hypothetical protein
MIRYLYLLILFSFLFSACNLVNPKEQIPTYLHLEPFAFSNADSNVTGSGFHNIPSVKVAVDDITVGTFDLPCTIPVMMSKTSTVLMVPQVTNQGLKSYVFPYPFYVSDTVTLQYNPGKVQNYIPKTRYSPDLGSTAFRMKINFEEGLLFRKLTGDTSFILEKDPAKVLEGQYSGSLYLDQDHKASENITSNYFEYPQSECYLEIEYRCTIPFSIGLQGEKTDGTFYPEYFAGFYPKEERNKVYIELGSFTKKNASFSKFFVIIRANLNDEDGKYKQGYVTIDNIKVISR